MSVLAFSCIKGKRERRKSSISPRRREEVASGEVMVSAEVLWLVLCGITSRSSAAAEVETHVCVLLPTLHGAESLHCPEALRRRERNCNSKEKKG